MKKDSNDTLVHDLGADGAVTQFTKEDVAACAGDWQAVGGDLRKTLLEWPDRPCHFCGQSALFEGAKQVQCVPYTDKAVCVECARRLVDLR